MSPKEALHRTGQAKEGVSCFASRARVSRLVSLLFAGGPYRGQTE
jgi:hypothetical protein